MKRRSAFTMIELIFVIVVIGIIAKFGVEFLIKAYDGYIFSSVQNRLQSETETALEEITNRLQYRIKSSAIVRDNDTPFANGSWRSLSNAKNNGKETILEWIGYDIDGLRGVYNGTMNIPTWSGFIDLDSIENNSSTLKSPQTNTTNANNIIQALSNGNSDFNDSAIFFIGANSDINGYGWGGAITDQNQTMHPIKSSATAVDLLATNTTANNLTGRDVYEYYQLAWTAYALVYSGTNASSGIGYINRLDNGSANPATLFDTNATVNGVTLMSTPITNVTGATKNGDWTKIGTNTYVVKAENTNVTFTYDPDSGSFDCTADATPAGKICERLRN